MTDITVLSSEDSFHPSQAEITVAEIDGKTLNLSNPDDPKTELYLKTVGVLYPSLQIPYEIPDHEFRKRLPEVVRRHPPQYNIFSLIREWKSTIEGHVKTWKEKIYQSFPTMSDFVFDTSNDKYFKSLEEQINEAPARFLAWHPYNSLFAVAHRKNVIFLYDLRIDSWFPEVLDNYFQKDITCMAWKPLGGNILAVGCRQGVCLWEIPLMLDPDTLQEHDELSFNPVKPMWMHYLNYPGHDNIVTLAWQPNGKFLVTGSIDGSIILWDTAFQTGKILSMSNRIELLSWSPDGVHLLASTLQGDLILWETSTWTFQYLKSEVSRPLKSACWAPDGNTLFFAFKDDTNIRTLWVYSDLSHKWLQAQNVSNFTVPEDVINEDIGGAVQQLAIDPMGERLVVCFEKTKLLALFHVNRQTKGADGSGLLTRNNFIRGPSWNLLEGQAPKSTHPKPISITFANQYTRGALLTVVSHVNTFIHDDLIVKLLKILYNSLGVGRW